MLSYFKFILTIYTTIFLEVFYVNRTEKEGHSRGKSSHKIGEAVSGVSAVFPSKTGKAESGKVVYKRKPEYEHDPFKKRPLSKEREI
jgi:hypothetical protein